jgi:hypothetical protein
LTMLAWLTHFNFHRYPFMILFFLGFMKSGFWLVCCYSGRSPYYARSISDRSEEN